MGKLLDMQVIKKDWPKYRCRPDVMIMADFYGHDSASNFEFCLKNGFDQQSAGAIAPFYSYLGSFVQTLMTMLASINSIRMTFATLVGTVTQVFQEFSGRIKALMYRIQFTAIRMRFLMGRVFGTMFSVIWMALSGIKATQNFGNTFLFKFLDTVCFDPDTQIRTKEGDSKAICDVRIGDVLEDGSRVTSTFAFYADGQPMVLMPGSILVSTNHFVKYEGMWIQACEHPDAVPAADWRGGSLRPLICLNTDTNTFRIGSYTFRDYDETSEGDKEAMEAVLQALNGRPAAAAAAASPVSSAMGCGPETALVLEAGVSIPAHAVRIGQELRHGKVVGVVKKEVSAYVEIQGERLAPGTSVWNANTNQWVRAEQLQALKKLATPEIFYNFMTTPSAAIETSSNTVFRDYLEIHDPAFEESYARAVRCAK